MVDVSKVSPTQEYIMNRHSKMVGKILDLVEASLPEGTQCEKLKKLLEECLKNHMRELQIRRKYLS